MQTAEATRSTIKVAGSTLSYQRAGHGTPLVFLHGEDGLDGWEPWMSALAARYDVIVPDHPAFGDSEWPAWLDDVHDLAYFYLDVFAALGLGDIHLVGHSLGGWIATEIAIRDCSPFRSLSLVASGGLRLIGVPKLDRFIIPPTAVTRAGFADPALAEAQLARTRTAEEDDRDLRNRFAAARLQWQPRHDLRLPKWMHRIRVPTHVIWGAEDQMVPPAYAAEFARLIPGARVSTISACGHFPQVERSREFVALLTAFVEEAQ
jgi:pimeloyl-ACP methyl ester carboxylesterase